MKIVKLELKIENLVLSSKNLAKRSAKNRRFFFLDGSRSFHLVSNFFKNKRKTKSLILK